MGGHRNADPYLPSAEKVRINLSVFDTGESLKGSPTLVLVRRSVGYVFELDEDSSFCGCVGGDAGSESYSCNGGLEHHVPVAQKGGRCTWDALIEGNHETRMAFCPNSHRENRCVLTRLFQNAVTADRRGNQGVTRGDQVSHKISTYLHSSLFTKKTSRGNLDLPATKLETISIKH